MAREPSASFDGAEPLLHFGINLRQRRNGNPVGDTDLLGEAAGVDQPPFGRVRSQGEAEIDARRGCGFDSSTEPAGASMLDIRKRPCSVPHPASVRDAIHHGR